jgi:uncharacterized damage-inducible protein DinB
MKNALISLFGRDLKRLKTEIESYENEEDIWVKNGQINNSAGNLTLHLIGNLKTYIGAEIGKSGYIRNRPAEFESKVSRFELLKGIEETHRVVIETLSNMDEKIFDEEYPIVVFKEKMQTGYFLIHLTGHLNYHLGQINYHRRLKCYR